MALPTSPPLAELAPRALPHLAAAVAKAAPSGPATLLPPLSLALRALARARLADAPQLSVPLAPLHAFTSLASEAPSAVPVQLLTDALLAYPAEISALSGALLSLLAEREGDLAALVRSAPSALLNPSAVTLLTTSRLMHSLLRLPGAHIVLAHARELVPALVGAYEMIGEGRQVVRAKAETLVLLRALLGSDASLRALLPLARTGAPLVDQNATADLALFSSQAARGEVADVLRALHDDERRDDPRLAPLLQLFPSLPAHLLADALAHPAFSAGRSGASAEEQAAPLVDAILARTLPPELTELRAATAALDSGAAEPEPSAPAPAKAKAPASSGRNVWTDVDFSKLRIKGHSDEVGTEIPDTLRASILRLVEAQEEEAEAAARAVAEAHGVSYAYSDEEDDVAPARARVGDGEDASDDEAEGDDDGEESSSRATPARKENTAQTLLELAYLRDPNVFGRDATTRRSAARADLRERTGMDDGQIEGWKIMLERNPHKDAILERHQFSREAAPSKPPRKEGSHGGGGESSRGGRGGGGGGRGGGGGGRGGKGGGSGGQGGQGGGGRGRGGSKGSRGHSNAARTRGHDKKMTRMGAGV